jgi:hypothetical protein
MPYDAQFPLEYAGDIPGAHSELYAAGFTDLARQNPAAYTAEVLRRIAADPALLAGLVGEGGLVLADRLPAGDGENYVLVQTTTDPIQNGLNLRAAVATANAKTPNGSANSGTNEGNRVDVYVPSGRYDLNGSGFSLNCGVNLIGLSMGRDQVYIYSTNSTYAFSMITLGGYNLLRGLYLKITSSTAKTALADDQASLLKGDGFYGNYILEDCVLSGLNLFASTTQNNFALRFCKFQQIRFTPIGGWFFEGCTTTPFTVNSAINTRSFSILGCSVSNTTQFHRCYVTLSDLPSGGAPRFIQCPFLKFTLESGTVNSYVSGIFYNCPHVTFVASVATSNRFYLSVEARNCYFYGVTHWRYQGACKFYWCAFHASVSAAQLAKPDAQAGVYVYFYHCLIHAADVANDYLLQLATGTAYLYMAHCSLYNGYTQAGGWTLRQSTLAAGFNEITPSAFGSLSLTAP